MSDYSYERVFTASPRRIWAEYDSRMTRAQAADVLGISSGATEEEVKRAYRQKVKEGAHPDQGGSTDGISKLNVARDIMLGEREATDDYRRAPSSGGPSVDPDFSGFRRDPTPKPPKVEVSFDDAAHKAGVPSNLPCMFKTETRYDSQGDRSASCFVMYGKTDANHVFVGVESYRDQNAFTGEDVDLWSMKVYEFPLSKDLAELAPRAIREAFADFKYCKKSYNAKVVLLGDKPFGRDIIHGMGSMSFKDAMIQLGAVGNDHGWVKDRKVTIELRIKSEGIGFDKETIHLVINGKDYDLGRDAYLRMQKGKALDAIFGSYYYEDSKKVLTKIAKAKAVLQWMIKNLKVDDEVKALLELAMEQAK